MKKLQIVILTAFLMAGLAAAQPSDLMNAGSTPGDPFYFFDRFSESMEATVAQAPLIGSKELEAKVRANHAEERLSEARKLIELNRSEKAEKMMEEYSRQLNRSVEASRSSNNTDLNKKLGNMTGKHLKTLEDVKNRVPAPAKDAVQRAIDSGKKSRAKIGKPETPGRAQERSGRPKPGKPGSPSQSPVREPDNSSIKRKDAGPEDNKLASAKKNSSPEENTGSQKAESGHNLSDADNSESPGGQEETQAESPDSYGNGENSGDTRP